MTRRPAIASVLAFLAAAVSRPVQAHVDYVTDSGPETRDALAFTVQVLSEPFNAALFVGAGLAVVLGVAAYLWVRPTITDIVILREKLASYADLVPWMLRLSVGLPLIGAGFQGYLFAPTVTFNVGANPFLRLLFIGLGFLTLFGLATRIVATVGLLTYAWALVTTPTVFIAIEYVPIFLALFVLGGGRPSADDMLQEVASTDGTIYGRVDPIHHLKAYLDERTRPLRVYVPVILRVGMGAAFVYLGLVQKLAEPSSGLAVVAKYNLTAVVPVDPGLWVVGAGVTEIAVGLALVAGFFTRGSAATAFVLFTLTLFGLPDDPVLAHVALFGMVSAVFTLGAGPLSFDHWFGRPAVGEGESVVPAD
ncbi:DoxX family protein [Haloarcula onubensis]|uniref:DoxX family protein n=1 Tax=Haloarcula onubensis TaxID=2950539 RepID=A0ABU2FTT0_9EURY|nr:DoxX family protein [Halomicroarcula sp. S3CR25-11]MDS0284168.1 DoxX family protein [Halomicroarcula sp. S3CR25-11]